MSVHVAEARSELCELRVDRPEDGERAPERRDCGRLLECAAAGVASCVTRGVLTSPASLARCYCGSNCANPDGPCVAEIEAVAKTSDPAEVIRQMNDISSVLSALAEDLSVLQTHPCYLHCP